MVVSDHFITKMVFELLVKQKGLDIDCANTGKECLQLLEQRYDQIQRGEAKSAYKLIVIKYWMIEMDCKSTTKEIRKLLRRKNLDPDQL